MPATLTPPKKSRFPVPKEHPDGSPCDDSPSGINLSLLPRPELLDIFPAHVLGDSSDRRHWLANIQRRVVTGMGAAREFKSFMACMAVPVPAGGTRKDGSAYTTKSPGKVQLHAYAPREDDGDEAGGASYGFAWVKKCGNPMTCFTCAPKVRWKRAQEVRRGIEWAIGEGLSAMMISLTAPHYADTDPGEQIDAVKSAWREFRSHRWWEDEEKRIGHRYTITVLEITMLHPYYGIGNGAHIHLHVLMLCDHPAFGEDEAEAIRAKWLPRWHDLLVREGVEIKNREDFDQHAIDITLPHAQGAVVDDAALTAMADYVSDRMAAEVSPGIFTKTGKGEGEEEKAKHVNHFEFFALALTQYPAARPYMLQLMRGLKGHPWMRWSQGFKAAAGIEEKTDQEIMEERKGQPVREYNTKTEWRRIDARKLQRRYIRAMADDLRDLGDALYLEDVKSSADRMMELIRAGFDPLTGEGLDEQSGEKLRAVDIGQMAES